LFCEDFDEGALGPWVSIITLDGGTLGLSDAEALSPPNSMRITLPAFDFSGAPIDASTPNEQVNMQLLGTYAAIRIALDLYLPDPLSSSQNAVGVVGLPAVCPNFLIGVHGGEVYNCGLPDGGATPIVFASPLVQTWTRISIDMTGTPKGADPATADTLAIYYDTPSGTSRVCCDAGTVSTPPTFVQPDVDLGLFDNFNARTKYSSSSWTIYMDNVTFDGVVDASTPLQPPL
jgi:hypothetical protein